MASETEQGEFKFEQNTGALLDTIKFQAEDRGLSLDEAFAQMELAQGTKEDILGLISVTEEESEKVWGWIAANTERGTIHPDSAAAITEMIGNTAVTKLH